MSAAVTRGLSSAALAALSALILTGPAPVSLHLAAVAPLAGLLLTALRPFKRWPLVTALVMLPYFCYGLMEILVNPPGRSRAMLFAALTVAAFLLALDSGRPR